MLINDAQKFYIGVDSIQKMYVGDVLIWPGNITMTIIIPSFNISASLSVINETPLSINKNITIPEPTISVSASI